MLIRATAPLIVSRTREYARMCGTGGPITFTYAMPFVVDGGGAVPSTGVKGSFPNIPYAFTILGWTLESPTAGGVTMDLLADAYAANSFPATSIIGGGTPITMAAVKSASGDVTGWTTTVIAAGSSLAFVLNAVATVTLFTLSLKCRRTIGL